MPMFHSTFGWLRVERGEFFLEMKASHYKAKNLVTLLKTIAATRISPKKVAM